MSTIPSICDECRAAIAARINQSASGLLHCNHGSNTSEAGVLVIVSARNMALSGYTLKWPVAESEALALVNAVALQVEGRLADRSSAH